MQAHRMAETLYRRNLSNQNLLQERTNVHFSNVHFVLRQNFGLNRLMPPFHAFFPPLLSSASALRELKWAITSPKKGRAMQRYHEEQSARSTGALLSPLDHCNCPKNLDVRGLMWREQNHKMKNLAHIRVMSVCQKFPFQHLGQGNCEAKVAARQKGVNSRREGHVLSKAESVCGGSFPLLQ